MKPLSTLREFLNGQVAGGLLLMVAAALAMVAANGPIAPDYFGILETKVAGLSVLHWINDALMAAFFLLVGLEIKRELLDGQLAGTSRIMLPGIAAAGGMLCPALIYLAINGGTEAARGWAIPSATDIAFSLAVLALLGPRVPVSLKVFLTALAILDDLGSIVIIAIFYTTSLGWLWLTLAAGLIVGLVALNRAGVTGLAPYMALGLLLWLSVYQSGIHPTLAGVALALTIPLVASPGHPDSPRSPLHRLEHALHPWVTFLIVPLFGFANAGLPLGGLTFADLFGPVPLGIALGLFLGKQLGVFLPVWILVKLKWTARPEDASFLQVYGVALVCGIGFTMSLFIGLLAFPDSDLLQRQLKLGVLTGSIASAIAGVIVLVVAGQRHRHAPAGAT